MRKSSKVSARLSFSQNISAVIETATKTSTCSVLQSNEHIYLGTNMS